MDLKIVYEDEFCLIVNKPNNLLVHHSHYARNIEEISLVEWLNLHYQHQAVPVHRLDRKTSGLILCAKNKQHVSEFQQLFEQKLIQKHYLALLRGHVPDSGLIDSPVKNERGNYKDAQSEFECLLRIERPYLIPPYPSQRYSVVLFKPLTGRMHQLRIHANKISHPIINDPKYGNRHHNHYFQEELQVSELFLHAWKLEFNHPFLKKNIVVKTNLPNFWTNFLSNNEIQLLNLNY